MRKLLRRFSGVMVVVFMLALLSFSALAADGTGNNNLPQLFGETGQTQFSKAPVLGGTKKTDIHLAFTSDAHVTADSDDSTVALVETWLNGVATAKSVDKFDVLGICGDCGAGSGGGSKPKSDSLTADSSTYWSKVSNLLNGAASNSHVNKSNMIVTTGNHEISDGSYDYSTTYTEEPQSLIVRLGEPTAYYDNTEGYRIYCMGAKTSSQAYDSDDVTALSEFLSTCGTTEPIFIMAHYPLHSYGNRTTENADAVISVLNNYHNVIFLWGHTHTINDTHYDKVYSGSIDDTAINFIYASVGCMNSGSGITSRGLEVDIDGDETLTMTYYDSSVEPVATYNVNISTGTASEYTCDHENTTSYAAHEATCTEAGNIAYWYCSDCERYFSDEACTNEISENGWVVPAINHENKVATEAHSETCTEEGNTAYWYCPDCDKYYGDEDCTEVITKDSWIIPAKGHANKVGYESHSESCTEDGNTAYWYCSDCDKYYSDAACTREIQKDSWILPAAHKHMIGYPAREGSCTEPGNTAYWYCSDCEKYFSDADGKKEIEEGSWVTAIVHKNVDAVKAVAATCTVDGNIDYWFCNDCHKCFSDEDCKTEIAYEDTVIDATGHAWDSGTVTTMAEIGKEGVITYHCTNNDCMATCTEAIPALIKTEDGNIRIKVNTMGDGEIAGADISGNVLVNVAESAKANKAGAVVIDVDDIGDATVLEVNLPSKALANVAESAGLDIVIESALGSVTLSADVLKDLADKADGKDITITITRKSVNEVKDKFSEVVYLNEAAVIDVVITCNGKPVTEFDGNSIEIGIPVAETDKSFAVGDIYMVYELSADNTITTLTGTCEGTENGKVITVLTKGLSIFAATPKKAVSFVDVKPGDYYSMPVAWAVVNNITSGMSATTFGPDETCTRCQVVTFLYRAAGEPEVKGVNPFVDVEEDSYYYNAVLWAVENGITEGLDETHFGPDGACTRGQVVTFLWRTANKPQAVADNPFTDVSSGEYYYAPVLWAVGENITKGTSDTTFSPDATCTRGQIVTFLYRYFN